LICWACPDKETTKIITKEENKKYHENGIFDYESHIELRQKSGAVMVELAGVSSKLSSLQINDDDDERIGSVLIAAIGELSELNKILNWVFPPNPPKSIN
jgi:hypothetical protein